MTFVEPYVEVNIDFNESGTFTSGSDVSSDIRYMAIERGKDVRQNKAAASVLRLELNNFDHKYDVSNPDSPLYPFQLPGPLIRVRMGYPADSFDGTNGTQLAGRTPDLAGLELGTWTATSSMTIQSNKIQINSTGTFIATLDYGEPNVRLAAKVKRPVTATNPHKHPLFVFRYVDSNNYAYLAFEGTSGVNPVFFRLHEVVDGSDSTIDTISAPGAGTWDEGDEVEMEAKVSRDTVEVYGWGQQAFAGQLTGLTKLTGTRHGIGGAGFTTDSENGGVTWDDFGLIVKFWGRVDTVEPKTSHEDKLAYLRAFDEFERLSKFTLFAGSPTPPATAGDIVTRILSRASFTRGSLIDEGTTLTPAAADSTQDTIKVMGNDALTELYQVQDDEVGFVYLDPAGVCHFEAADHRELNDHDVSITTWLAGSDQEKYWLGPMDWDNGKEGVENRIFYEYYRSSKVSNQVVWGLQDGDDPQFDFDNRLHPNDSSLALIDIVTIGDSDGVADPKIPVPVTDYTAHENADETGQDWLAPLASEVGTVSMTVIDGSLAVLDDTGQDFTASTTIAGQSFARNSGFIVIQDASGNTAIAKTVGNPDGDGTKVNLVKNPEDVGEPGLIASDPDFSTSNTPLTYDCYFVIGYPISGFEGNFQYLRFIASSNIELTSAPTVYLTFAQLKGGKLTNSDTSAARAEDSSSQSRYGLRTIKHQAKHIADWETATGRAEKRLALRKEARELVGVRMHNSTEANLMEIMFRDISDRVRIRYDDASIDRDHFIEFYTMEFEPADIVRMRWELTRVVPDSGLNYRYGDSAAKYGTATYAPPDS